MPTPLRASVTAWVYAVSTTRRFLNSRRPWIGLK